METIEPKPKAAAKAKATAKGGRKANATRDSTTAAPVAGATAKRSYQRGPGRPSKQAQKDHAEAEAAAAEAVLGAGSIAAGSTGSVGAAVETLGTPSSSAAGAKRKSSAAPSCVDECRDAA